jgi:hypothetical protein
MTIDRMSSACKLRDLMSDISEECYCATWLIDCEFELWEMLETGPRKWGVGEVTAEQIVELKSLHHRCAGWVMFQDGVGEVFVDKREWKGILAEYNRKCAAAKARGA